MTSKHTRFISLLAAAAMIAALFGCAVTDMTAKTAEEATEAAVTMAAAGTPDWFFHDIVDASFVKQYAEPPRDEKVMIIDSRPYKPKYFKGHIPMAISIPDTKFDQMTDKLPADKDALLIFYCGGLKCKLSHKSAAKAEKLGYTNVKVFAEGFPGWMKIAGNYPEVTAEWLKKEMDAGTDMFLVDSRPKRAKYDKGHIESAVSIPDTHFEKMTDQLPEDKAKLLVFYCGGFNCKLSHKSADKAIAMGYSNVKVFAAGYPGWKKYLAEIGETPATPAKAVAIKAGKEEGSIDHAYFMELVTERPDSVYFIDVRDPDEFAKGSLTSAVNIPVDKLEDKIKALPTDKPIVFICGTGARSGESYYMVQDLRPDIIKNVFYVDGEMKFKKDGTCTLKKPAS